MPDNHIVPQSRTIVEVYDPRWIDINHTAIVVKVIFEELQALGPLDFATVPNSDTEHGQLIWDNAMAGEYGEIAEYEAPPPPPLMPLTRRQLRLGLLENNIMTTDVEAAISTIPDPKDRAKAEIEWVDASNYEREHPLIAMVGAALGLTESQIDSMWEQALTL